METGTDVSALKQARAAAIDAAYAAAIDAIDARYGKG